jgi:hypothetical protein
MTQVSDVAAALEMAAGAGDEALTGGMINRRSIPSPERERTTYEIVRRFVEAIPEGTTVDELRDALDTIALSEGY